MLFIINFLLFFYCTYIISQNFQKVKIIFPNLTFDLHGADAWASSSIQEGFLHGSPRRNWHIFLLHCRTWHRWLPHCWLQGPFAVWMVSTFTVSCFIFLLSSLLSNSERLNVSIGTPSFANKKRFHPIERWFLLEQTIRHSCRLV